MKASAISTLSLNMSLRSSTASLQRDLVNLQQEVVNGRFADNGLALGVRMKDLSFFQTESQRVDRIIDTNARVLTRLKATQEAIGKIAALGENLTSAVSLSFGDQSQRSVVVQTARNALDEAVGLLNTRVGGNAIFGGINTSVTPMQDYEGSPIQTAVENAFLTRFGFPINDPASAGISGTDMADFLENDLRPVFFGPDWNTFSVAADEVQSSRISDGVTADTGVSANEEAFRSFFLGAAVAFEFNGDAFSGDALQAVSRFSIEACGTGVGKMADLRGQVGLTQARIDRTIEQLGAQSALMTSFATELQQVDVFEKSAELNNVITQIEISYSVTARVQQLSIMRFLR